MIKTWDYRVIIKDGLFQIHEVYYNQDRYPVSISEEEIAPAEEDFKELKITIKLMGRALDKPVLKYSDFIIIKKEKYYEN